MAWVIGLTFGIPEQVCDTSCENGFNHTYLFVDPAGNVHVTYHKRLAGVWQVFYKMRTSAGWEEAERVVFTDTADAKYPSVAVIGDSVFLVWHDYRVGGIRNVEIFFNRKPISGDTWAYEERLTFTNSGSVGDNGYVPTLKPSPEGDLRVVWYDYRDDPDALRAEIYTKLRSGGVWSEDIRVSDSPANAWYPSFTFGSDGDSVLYVWTDNRSGSYRILWSDTYNEGEVSPRTGYYPDIAFSSGRYLVVWEDASGEVWASHRDPGGDWSSPFAVRPNGRIQKFPTVIPCNGGFVVAWREDYDPYISNIVGVILGGDLTVKDSFVIPMEGIQERPTLFLDSYGYLHIAFVDRSLGSSNPRIFYARSTSPLTVKEAKPPSPRKVSKVVIRRRIIVGGMYDASGRRHPTSLE
ncbi:MAG: hypothetical protein GXO39_07245 [Thermotogae bacterium]|nr:hypothetical protein [Thermotogota bacterium]